MSCLQAGEKASSQLHQQRSALLLQGEPQHSLYSTSYFLAAVLDIIKQRTEYRFKGICVCSRAASCPATGQQFRKGPKVDLGVCLQAIWFLTLLRDSRGSCQIAGPISAALPAHCGFIVRLHLSVGVRLVVKTC